VKVHVYTAIDTLFGRASRPWMGTLLEAGHEVEFIDMGNSTDMPRREATVQASQTLLRERFSPAAWQGRMLSMIEGIA
jgi:hypothetical protein